MGEYACGKVLTVYDMRSILSCIEEQSTEITLSCLPWGWRTATLVQVDSLLESDGIAREDNKTNKRDT